MFAGILYGMAEALVTALFGSTYTQIVMFTAVIAAAGADAQRPVRPGAGQRYDEAAMNRAPQALQPLPSSPPAGLRRWASLGEGYTHCSCWRWSR